MATYWLSSSSGPGCRPWGPLRKWLEKHTYPPHWLPPRWQHPAIGYIAATSLAVIAAGLTLLLEVAFPPLVLQGALLAVVIVLVALNWGEGPSFLVTLIGAFFLAFVALPPHFSWEIDDRSEIVGFVLFLVTGVMMNLIASQVGERGGDQSNWLTKLNWPVSTLKGWLTCSARRMRDLSKSAITCNRCWMSCRSELISLMHRAIYFK